MGGGSLHHKNKKVLEHTGNRMFPDTHRGNRMFPDTHRGKGRGCGYGDVRPPKTPPRKGGGAGEPSVPPFTCASESRHVLWALA